MTLPALVPPSARDLTRDYMLEQLGVRGIPAPWSTGIPPQRPARFFTIEELNSSTPYGIFADAQLIQIRAYDADRQWLGETMRLVKALWKVMPAQLQVQDVEHAGGPLYDEDPNVDGLYYGQVISWVTVINQIV
jgi:hypothetical protein